MNPNQSAYKNLESAYKDLGGPGYAFRAGDSMQDHAPNAPPVNSVRGELETNEKRCSALHSLLDVLQQRLQPILAAERPTPKGNGEANIQPSAIVAALRGQGYQIDGACMRIQDLLDRLEV